MPHFSTSQALAKIRRIETAVQRPVRDILDTMGRTTALEMARRAVPFGTGSDARDAGEKAVRGDISKVYATPGKAYGDISDARGKAAFWSAYIKKDYERAESLLREFGNNLRYANLREFDGGAAHKSARNRITGRVRQKYPAFVVVNPRALQRYVEEEVKHVGTAKGGFADIVRAIGGNPRGLRTQNDITANWITRHGRGYGQAVHTGSDEHPTLTITNRVPYADNTLQGAAFTDAKRVGRDRALAGLLGMKAELLNEIRRVSH